MALDVYVGSLTQYYGVADNQIAAFAQRPDRPLSRDQLLNLTQNRDWNPFDRSIDIRIARLRRKLDDDPQNPKLIKTVYGAGYLFSAQVEWK